jgi:hypothetical protein
MRSNFAAMHTPSSASGRDRHCHLGVESVYEISVRGRALPWKGVLSNLRVAEVGYLMRPSANGSVEPVPCEQRED